MTETYYAGRSARDPDRREAQIARAREREHRRSAEDPATGRTPEAEAASGLTFNELWLRVGGDRGSLWAVLRSEVRRGRIDYHPTTRRYVLNGGLDPALRQALLRVGRADDDADSGYLPRRTRSSPDAPGFVARDCRVPGSGAAFATAKSGKASEGATRD